MKILVLFSFLFFTQLLHANAVIGKITKVRGSASVLELGKKEANPALEGQTIHKDSSIVTSEKSFIRIVMLDGTQINLGPSSKIILDQTGFQNVGVVSLLRGMLRTVVEKEKNGKDKLYIKTRTAALGIRGTDFLTNYNPESKITNLVTFRGQVAMVKNENKDLRVSLSSTDVVLVDSGKFSAVNEKLSNATEPVKISSIQFTGLKLNNEMNSDNKVSKKLFEEEFEKTITKYIELSKEESKIATFASANYDANKKTLRPTSGGIVDLESGIYVPPSENAQNFNKDLNIYELKSEKGQVTEAGNYIPPQGILLDAKLGFIVDSKVAKVDNSIELRKLNKDISSQLNSPSKSLPKPSREDLKESEEDAYDKYFIKE